MEYPRRGHGAATTHLARPPRYGTVFEGRAPGCAPCAVKKISKVSCRNVDDLRTLADEIEALRALSGSGATPALLAAIASPRFLYIAMEFGGETLSRVLEEDRYVGLGLKAPVVVHGVATALATLHAKGFVHLDLKSDNVLVTRRDGRVVDVRLCDLGFAQRLEENGPPSPVCVSRTGDFDGIQSYAKFEIACGSAGFWAPEMIIGSNIDGRAADIWSFACLALETIIGTDQFDRSWLPSYENYSVGIECDYHFFVIGLALPLKTARDMARAAGPLPKTRALVSACLSVDAAARPSAAACRDWLAGGDGAVAGIMLPY